LFEAVTLDSTAHPRDEQGKGGVASGISLNSTGNLGQPNRFRTMRALRMDCGWQNQGEAPDNHFECERSLASSAACIRSADPPQTSGMRDVLAPFAMISSRLTSIWAHGELYPAAGGCAGCNIQGDRTKARPFFSDNQQSAPKGLLIRGRPSSLFERVLSSERGPLVETDLRRGRPINR